jgi:hypothetical protein
VGAAVHADGKEPDDSTRKSLGFGVNEFFAPLRLCGGLGEYAKAQRFVKPDETVFNFGIQHIKVRGDSQ